jgi:hypothetical protein
MSTSQEALGAGLESGLDTIASQLRYNQAQRQSERDKQADAIAEQMKAVAQNIVRVGGKDKPEAAPLMQQLQTLSQQHNALYPPHETPALLQRLRTLTGHARNQPQLDPRANATPEAAVASAKLPEYNTTRAGQIEQAGISGEIEGLNNDVVQKIKQKNNDATIAWAQKHNIPDDVLQDLQATLAGVPATLLKPPAERSGQWEDLTGTLDGKRVTLHHSKALNTTTDFQGNPVDPEVLKRFVPDDKFAPVKNKQAWIIDPTTSKPLSIMLDANNHRIPGTENPDAVPPPGLFGRITTTDYITDDGFGNIISIPKTTVSGPVGTGGAAPPNSVPTPTGAPTVSPAGAPAGGAGLPKTPAEARSLLPQPGGAPKVIASKASKPYQEAKVNFDKATGIVDLAKAAAEKKSALSDRNLAIRMAREASGRFSMAEYDTMIKNAGLGNTFEQWMNNITSGALPDNIRNQLISVAYDNQRSAKAALDSASGKPAPTSTTDDEILKKLDKISVPAGSRGR